MERKLIYFFTVILGLLLSLLIGKCAMAGECCQDTTCEICGAPLSYMGDCSDSSYWSSSGGVFVFPNICANPMAKDMTFRRNINLCEKCYGLYWPEIRDSLEKRWADWLEISKAKEAQARIEHKKDEANRKIDALEVKLKEIRNELKELKGDK